MGIREALASIPMNTVKLLSWHHPVLLWFAPLALVRFMRLPLAFRWIAVYSVVTSSFMMAIMPGQGGRYALASWILISGVIAIPAVDAYSILPGILGKLSMIGLVVVSFSNLVVPLRHQLDPASALACLTGSLSADEYRGKIMGPFEEVRTVLSNRPDVRGILVLGSHYTYRLPGRCRPGLIDDRNPAWELTSECVDRTMIRKRLHQWKCNFIAANIAVQFQDRPWVAPFAWDAIRLARWREFIERDAELVSRPSRMDMWLGAWAVYRLREKPIDRPPSWIPYLPGPDGIYQSLVSHGPANDIAGWIVEARDLVRRLPRVYQIESLLAAGYLMNDQPEKAYRSYLPGIEHGHVDEDNLWGFGRAAALTGRTGIATRYIRKAIMTNPALENEGKIWIKTIESVR